MKSRRYNCCVNSAVGIVTSILTVALNYIVRMVIVRELGPEINGLHNLFQSIINVMALMETSFSTSMIIHLYKPIEEHNINAIKSMISFYKNIYRFISISFLIVCVFIDFFAIDYIITSTIYINEIRLYFILFALSFVFSYYTYYKRCILFAEQKNRVSALFTFGSMLFFRSLEIFSIIIYHNYYLLLMLASIEKMSSNILCNIYINKEYPYLKNIKNELDRLDNRSKQSVFNTVKSLLVFNISNTIQQSSKSILISYLLGNIKIVGYFGNYMLVVNSAQLLFAQFGGAFTSSFGNLAVINDIDRMFNAYNKTCFILNWISITICAGFISCIQYFILFAFGEEYVISESCAFVMMVDLFIYLFEIPIISVQNALGLHNLDKNYMILQSFFAVLLGIILGKLFGMIGILIGLSIPNVVFTLFHKGIIIYKKLFKKSASNYTIFVIIEMFKFSLVILINYHIMLFIKTKYILFDFFAKGVFSIFICVILFIIFSIKNKYFIELLNFLKLNHHI